MTKTNKSYTDSLLENILAEDVPPVPPESSAEFEPVEQVNMSLDQVVDRYIVRYERDSIPTNEVYESFDKFHASLFLLEQDDLEPLDDDEDLGDDDAAGGDLDLGGGDDLPADDAGGGLGGEPLGGGDAEAPVPGETVAPAVAATPQININDFARAMARLVGNFEALLDPKSVIINRAEAYIASNYDQRTADEFRQVLEVNYGFSPADNTNTASPTESEFPTPYTAGANGAGAGAA